MNQLVHWAGGKTQLLDTIKSKLPDSFNKYYEPFLGGGALLFELQPKTAIVNDVNDELINLYRHVRDSPELFIALVQTLDELNDKSDEPGNYYYRIRKDFNDSLGSNTIEQAARFVYLNKHCYGGLYRVNRKGQFNVSANKRKNIKSCDPDSILEMSDYLKNVTLLNGDFEAVLQDVEEGDFVFMDSPYAPLNPTSFTKYTKDDFDHDDHVRLANVFKELTERGAYCMTTNHNTELIRVLYADYRIDVVEVSRPINSNINSRKSEEVIITNY